MTAVRSTKRSDPYPDPARQRTTLAAISSFDTFEEPLSPRLQRTLERIFERPDRSDIPWREVVALLQARGAKVTEGAGSRVRVHLNGVRAVFHRPHPGNVTHAAMIRSVRRFLTEARVTP